MLRQPSAKRAQARNGIQSKGFVSQVYISHQLLSIKVLLPACVRSAHTIRNAYRAHRNLDANFSHSRNV